MTAVRRLSMGAGKCQFAVLGSAERSRTGTLRRAGTWIGGSIVAPAALRFHGLPGKTPLEHIKWYANPTATTRSTHEAAQQRIIRQSFATESEAAATVAAQEPGPVVAVRRILAPHRPLGEQMGYHADEWKQDATSKIAEVRAALDATPSRKKRRQPSLAVPQLWSEDELEEQFVRGSGPGGQKINKTSCCVLISVR